MKILIIIIVVLGISSVGYLFLVTPATIEEVAAVPTTESFVPAATLDETMCTSTACQNEKAGVKDEIAVVSPAAQSADATMEVEKVPEPEKPNVKKIVTEAVKSIFSEKEVVPVEPTAVRYTEFVNPSGFVNTEPFKMGDYIGKKVILVEFITYTCINCQRTFPFMKQWHETYAKDGLLVIGIHTPEFSYERDRDNVVAAMKKEGITFPIVQDNEYQTWNAYANRFWPHRYIIDYNGNVVFDHIGEGAYKETEEVIKLLLANKPVGV